MRKTVGKMLAFVLLISIIFTGSNTFASTSFKDLGNDFWANAEIDYLVQEEIIKGFSDGTFKPNQKITKTQAAIILVNALELKIKQHATPYFTDVQPSHFAYNEIATAVDAGIFPSGGKFHPNQLMTREEAAVAISNAFQLKGNGSVHFSDVAPNSKSYQAIASLAENDITTGYPDGKFNPNKKVTRAQFSTLIARALSSDFLPNQYNIPFNMNPVEIAFKFAIVHPEGAQDIFLPSSNFNLTEFGKNVQSFEIVNLQEVARLNGETEFSVTFNAELQNNYNGSLVEGENHLYFLINRVGYMDYRVVSVGAVPHLVEDDSISFTNEKALSLLKESKLAYWYVVSGGDGMRDETTFNQNGIDYRYMAESLDSIDKIKAYLSKTYAMELVDTIIKNLGIITNNGKAAQPIADGGSLLKWENASIIKVKSSTTEKTYEIDIPLGDSTDMEQLIGEVHFVPGSGWRVHSLN